MIPLPLYLKLIFVGWRKWRWQEAPERSEEWTRMEASTTKVGGEKRDGGLGSTAVHGTYVRSPRVPPVVALKML